MAETTRFSPESEVTEPTAESRFGDIEYIEEAMSRGDVKSMGAIEQHISDIPAHRNLVELAYANLEVNGARNFSELAVVNGERGEIWCVFKPQDGEDKKFHDQNELGHDYSRERAAYLVSQHFGFDLVPPTVIKQINGRIGSLQLFVSQDRYVSADKAELSQSWEAVAESDDLKKMSVLDWLLANSDRHNQNYLVNRNVAAGTFAPQLVAIDNGASFNQKFYRIKSGRSLLSRSASLKDRQNIPGPYLFLTNDPQTLQPTNTPLPDWLVDQLSGGARDYELLHERLTSLPDISYDELEQLKKRLNYLNTERKFLSGNNFNLIRGKIE